MSLPDKNESQSASQNIEPVAKPVRIKRPLPTEPELVMKSRDEYTVRITESAVEDAVKITGNIVEIVERGEILRIIGKEE